MVSHVLNSTDRPLTLTLVLAVRPFQVNPPTQFLNAPGGVSTIETIAWDGDADRRTLGPRGQVTH